MRQLQNSDDPPLEASPQGHQLQNTVGPAIHGDNNTCPSSHNPPPQSGDKAPSTASMTFPKCGHVISGPLYLDFLTKPNSDCPVCQQGPFQSVIKFGSHEHIIHGDPLRQEFKSSPCQCPACLPSSDKDVATDAHSTPTNPTPTSPIPTTVHTERSRVTLNRYQDPFTFEGVTGEMYTGKDGAPRLRVDEKVWRSWSSHEKDRFVYSTNIRFGNPIGEHQPAPTNPANPKHVDHKPLAQASIIRRNLKQKPDPDGMAAAIRELLATPDQDVLSGRSPLRQLNGVEAQTAVRPNTIEPIAEEDNPEDVTRDGLKELYYNPWQ